MAELLIGHTTQDSVRIWVRASAETRSSLSSSDRVLAFLRVIPASGAAPVEARKTLKPNKDFTGVIEVSGLQPAEEHTCELSFGATANAGPGARVTPTHPQGRFKTFPATTDTLDFLLGSCNTRHKHSDSAFLRIAELAQTENAAFMIHCGDQIYYPRAADPEVDRYREQYRKTWQRSPVRNLFTRLPHYMILDDHEIRNNFRNDRPAVRTETGLFDMRTFKRRALRVYREYQHSHNPQSHSSKLYYEFSSGDVRFFVMDIRTERRESTGKMISPTQMTAFFDWLRRFPGDLKFVVTAVPFLAEVIEVDARSPGRDKWCGKAYEAQRQEILQFLCDETGLRQPVFLTGDMHNSYHATMRLNRGSESFRLHELMSSPINQKTTSLGQRARYILNSPVATPFGWNRVVKLVSNSQGEQYFDGPNIMHIRVKDPWVRFWIYPTREGTGNAPVSRGAFQP
ncbi:MAG: alkaline phosphatase family protein [bacterium]|nr:alkaline phosphatase family protein [bacterium]